MADLAENSDMSIVQKLPVLPEEKSRHFFVSYSCEERDKVIEILDELERRFPVKCYYSDRDFQAGKDIAVNIKEGMATSIKVLLFVSPSFLQSGWCKYETDAAFVTSMGCGYSCIVPVLLEQCEIPPTLVTLTYIDATSPGIDIPAKIASSLLSQNTDDGILGLNMQSQNKIYENGYCCEINADREPLWPIRPAKYKFTIKQNVLESMKLNKVAVPLRLLKNAFRVINDNSVMWSFDYRNPCKTCLWTILFIIPFSFLSLGLICTAKELEYSSRNSTDGEANDFFNDVTLYNIVLVMSLVLMLLLPLCTPILCSLKRRNTSLQRQLWESLLEECIKNNILLLFSSRKYRKPTLIVMRYNVSRCKEYLVGIIQSKNLSRINDELTPEKLADNLVESYLARMTKFLADEFESLPDAPYNRHNVKSGKMCICQQMEQCLIEER